MPEIPGSRRFFLNLSWHLVGIFSLMLVFFSPGSYGQVFIFAESGPGTDQETISETVSAVQGVSDWIVILEDPAIAEFRRELNARPHLNEIQQDRLWAYQRHVESHQRSIIALASQQGLSLTVRHTYRFLLNGLAVSVANRDAARLAQLPGVLAVYPDYPVHLDLAESVRMIGADQVWQMLDADQQAVTGQGVRIAVLDTGIDYTHPDLGGCFGPGCKVVEGYDLYNNDLDPMDDNGHGTHCAGIAAADGDLMGVAPGASLYAYKVLGASGSGYISIVIAGIERAADPDQDPTTLDSVDIISMSLGIPGTSDDPWSLAVDAAVEQGIVVTVSAGNSGPDYASIESPGLARLAVTVGAVDKSNRIAAFSSRGPIPGIDSPLKPDILAPGVDIISTFLGGTYATASGTSMAAPHAAGAAALIRQLHPAWTPAQIKSGLMNTALDLGYDVHTQGAGLLQVNRAVVTPGLVTPGSVSFGSVDLSQSSWSANQVFFLENVTETVRSYSISAQTWLPNLVNVDVAPGSLTLLPGEKHSFSVTLTVNPLQTPPDLERNAGLIRLQQADVVLQVPFVFFLPPVFMTSRSLPFDLQTSYAVELQDLDGDSDLDAFIGNTSYYDNPANTIWLNDGLGNFIDSGQRLGSEFTWDLALGDVDGDGDYDAFVANSELDSPLPDQIWLNNGQGLFLDSGQRLGNTLSRAVALGDLDGDGDLDGFVVNGISARGQAQADSVWLNDGFGFYYTTGQSLGSTAGLGVELGDLDGDGDLDAFVTNGDPQRGRGEPNQVWLNDGFGYFSDSGQNLGAAISQAVTLGDLDADGDLDAFIANGGPEILYGQPDEVWLNNGSGIFSNSGQILGNQSSYGAALADFYQDGFLDVFVAGYYGGNRVWLNDGEGNFSLSSPGLGTENAADVALGDVDRDGDVDALVANAIGRPNRLWLNRGRGNDTGTNLASPSGLVAAAFSDHIALSWTDHAVDETSYYVERSFNGSTDWVQIAGLPANSTTFSDTDLLCDQIYYYRVRAYRSADQTYSLYSSIAAAALDSCSLSAPNDLFAVMVSCDQVELSWADHSSSETAYHVERSDGDLAGWRVISILPENSTTYTDTDLEWAREYQYRVRAYRESDGLYSPYSNTVAIRADYCQAWIYLPGIVINRP